jgi:CBS domain-containing membrane protein
MLTIAKPFLDLTADDLMSRDLITIPRHLSIRAAAHLLAQARVSGAPVTDETGRCVGVLSTTDVAHWVDEQEPSRGRTPNPLSPFCCDWQEAQPGDQPRDSVARYMTTDLVTARPDARISELARWMLDAHIHRVIVTDGAGRPVGIVSSTDVLAAVARQGGGERC